MPVHEVSAREPASARRQRPPPRRQPAAVFRRPDARTFPRAMISAGTEPAPELGLLTRRYTPAVESTRASALLYVSSYPRQAPAFLLTQ